MPRRTLILGLLVLSLPMVLQKLWNGFAQESPNVKRKVQKSDAEWAKLLTKEQYQVTRRKATEPAFSGKYANSHGKGVYACVCCGAELFSSGTKFDSGTGWPSFYQPINEKRIDAATDDDLGYPRTEVMCKDCGAHLGHVFDDGPRPTGLRYCINSLSLKMIPAEAAATKQTKAKGADAKSSPAPDKEKSEPESTVKP